MSSPDSNNPSKQKMQQLLASIGSKPAQGTAPIEAVEYNWHEPHYFSSGQLKQLESFAEKTAQACTEKFSQLYRSQFDVKIVSTTQYFANEFAASDNSRQDYFLAFGSDKNPAFGLVAIPPQAAIMWTTQLLGDNKAAEDYNRTLSQLEKSLLLDIAAGITEAFSNAYGSHDLHPDGECVQGEIPLKLKENEELCKITFSC